MFKHIIEYTSLIASLVVIVHYYFYTDRQLKTVFLFFSGALFLGTISEAAAIISTGSYHYPGFRWYIGPVPLFIAFGWCSSFYMIYHISRQLTFHLQDHKHFFWIVAAGGGFVGLFMDLFFDPVAISMNWWEWKNGGPYFNVPTANFSGWFVFAAGFCATYNLALSKDWSYGKKVIGFYGMLVGVFIVTALCSFPFLMLDFSFSARFL